MTGNETSINLKEFSETRTTKDHYLDEAFAFAESNLGLVKGRGENLSAEEQKRHRQEMRASMRKATANFWQERSLKEALPLQSLSQDEMAGFLTEKLSQQELEENGAYYLELMRYMTRGVKGKINFMLARYVASDKQGEEIIGKKGQILKGAARTVRAASLAREQEFGQEPISYAEIFRQRLEARSAQLKRELEAKGVTPSLQKKAERALGKYRRAVLKAATGAVLLTMIQFGQGPAIDTIKNAFFSPIEVKAFSDQQAVSNLTLEQLGLDTTEEDEEPSPTATPTSTATPTQTATPTPTMTNSPTSTETALPTNTPTETPVREKVPKPSPTLIMKIKQMLPVIFGSGKQTPEKVMPPTKTATATSSPTALPTNTPTPAETVTASPTATETTEPTATASPTPSPTEVPPTPTTMAETAEFNQDSYAARISRRIFPKIQQLRQERAKTDPEYLDRVDPELAANTINFAVIGLDAGKTTENGQIIARADAPIILSVNINSGEVTAVRPPRDLHAPEVDNLTEKYKEVPFRINAMTVFGGSEDASSKNDCNPLR